MTSDAPSGAGTGDGIAVVTSSLQVEGVAGISEACATQYGHRPFRGSG